jgi:hypothetical protein
MKTITLLVLSCSLLSACNLLADSSPVVSQSESAPFPLQEGEVLENYPEGVKKIDGWVIPQTLDGQTNDAPEWDAARATTSVAHLEYQGTHYLLLNTLVDITSTGRAIHRIEQIVALPFLEPTVTFYTGRCYVDEHYAPTYFGLGRQLGDDIPYAQEFFSLWQVNLHTKQIEPIALEDIEGRIKCQNPSYGVF